MANIMVTNRFLLTSLLFLCALTSCKNCPDEREFGEKAPLSSHQILKLNNQGDPTSLNPHLGIDLNCRTLQKALYEGLTRIKEGQPTLALAEKVDIDPTHTIYTFTLRNTTWSNGEPVFASHFETSWKRALNPTSACLRADLFYPIKNAKKAKKGLISLSEIGVKALDEYTLVVELEHPTPYFLNLLSLPLYSPLYKDETEPTVFNGPFILKEWEHDRSLNLVKNPLYWDQESVQLAEISISLVKDPNTVLLMYEKGEIDWMGSPFTLIPVDVIPQVQDKSYYNSQPVAGVYWLSCNTEAFPLNSPNIRKALSLSLDREQIASNVLFGETPSSRLLPLNMHLAADAASSLKMDLPLARKYFQMGLKELHLTEETFPALVLSHSDIAGQKKLAELLADQWKKNLNLAVEIDATEWNTFFSNLQTRQYQIGGCIWYSVIDDPIYSLEFFKEKTHRCNASQWENVAYKNLLDCADQETDLVKRREYLHQAEQLLLDEMPVIPLFVAHYKYLLREHVKGIYISPMGLVDLKWAYLETAAHVSKSSRCR